MRTPFFCKFNTITIRTACLSLLAIPLMVTVAVAQSEVSTEIRPNGNTGEITITSAETTKAIFVTTLKNNLSQYVDLAASGPSGIKGYAEIRQIKRGGKLGPVFRLEFPKKKKTTTILLDGSGKAATVSEAPVTLAGEVEDQIDRIAAKTSLSKDTIRYLLKFMTEDEIVARYGKTTPTTPTNPTNPSDPSNPTPQTQPGQLAGRGMVSKDNCDKSVSGYQLSFIVDLSGVDRAAAGSSFKVTGAVTAQNSQASVASIKPVSDGKFAPLPLILIQGTGYSYGGIDQALRVVKWANGRPKSTKSLKIEGTIYYRGQALARSIVQSALTGGKGTFEIYNGTNVGVACFSLIRTRQKANGYQGGD